MLRRLTTRIVGLSLAAVLAAGVSGCVGPGATISLPVADLAGPRLLVISPHPDDETVGAGGAIATARERGWDVTVVFVTSGDGFWQAVRTPGGPMPSAAQMQAYGASRIAEARRATVALGVPASNVIFLGFPDGSTHFMWGTNYSGPPVEGVNGARKVPYAFAFKPGAPYTGAELESELAQIVKRVRPTTVLMPDAADTHRDHWAANAFTQAALVRSGYSGLELTYLVHRTGFPAQRGLQLGLPIGPPTALLRDGTKWLSLPIGDAALKAQQTALGTYRSQLHSDGGLVRAFVRSNEMLGMGPSSFIGTGTVTLREGTHDPLYRGGRPRSTLDAIALSRTETSATVALDLAAPVDRSVRYVIHLRAYGPGLQMRFYDGTIAGGKLTASRDATASVRGAGQLVGFSGDVVRVKLPAELIDGARWLFLGADTYSGKLTADHGAWRMVRVLPH
ncbi:MAG: PIG-L family deacetylase [Coriobacteriia bacterium]|nr:PIG-L family deacetylase [Coriobacteriia bacterium]